MRKVKVFILLILFLPTIVFAASPIDTISRGLEAYEKNGPRAAIEAWIKGSGLEGSKEALSQANVLKQIEDYYGDYDSYE